MIARVPGPVLHSAVIVFALTLGGCGWFKNVALDMFVDSLAEGGDSIRGHFDWDTAGHGAASTIIQLEALYAVRPDNDALALSLAKSYMAYAYGWVMDAHGEALLREEYDEAEHHRRRAHLMYSRARNVARRALLARHPDIDDYLYGDPDKLLAFMREECTDVEDDVPLLYWTMITWSSSINADDESEEFMNMPAVKAIAQRVIELDEDYESAGAVVYMGGFWSSYPKAAGGDPDKGRAYFERALKLTDRRNHIILINYATMYAVNVLDEELYRKILMEIIMSPDRGNGTRLSNKVARRRAHRLLKRTDEFF